MRTERRHIRSATMTALLALIVAACGGGTGGDTATTVASDETTATTGATDTTATTETTAGATDTTAAETTETSAAAEAYRAVIIYPGTNDDQSWSNSWYDGAQAAIEANPGLEVETVELINDVDAAIAQGSAFAAEGVDLILIAHGGLVDAALQLAEQFPDVQVCLAPYQPAPDEEQPANLCWIDIEQHHANFLAGALAALVSETGQIASVNGFAFPGLTRQPEAFHLGARCVNPDIVFNQTYIESWTDTALAKSAAQALIAGGADVVLSATDSAVFGIIEAVSEASGDAWVIPSYYDSDSIAPEEVLTSAVHGLAFASTALLEKGVAGELQPFENFTAQNDPEIAAAPLYDDEDLLTDEARPVFEEIETKVRAGEIVIPDETEGDNPIGVEGAGGTVDPASIGC